VSGLIPASALAGYQNDAVYLRNSWYVPPRWEAVHDAIPALFDLIEAEPEPSVRAVLGHWLFAIFIPIRWQRPYGPLPDECPTGFRWVSLDGGSR